MLKSCLSIAFNQNVKVTIASAYQLFTTLILKHQRIASNYGVLKKASFLSCPNVNYGSP